MKNKIYEILKLVLSLLIFFFFGDIVSFILGLFGFDISNISDRGAVIYQFIVSLIMLVLVFIMYYKYIQRDYKSFKSKINKNITYIIKMFFIFMVVKYLVSFISVLIMLLLNVDTSSITSINQNLIETYLKTSPVLMFVTTALFAPVYEEILFRMGFKKAINNKLVFVLISGTIFGLMHVFPLDEGISLVLGIIQSISYVTMGIFLSYIYAKTNNIFMSIEVHFLNNFLSVLTMLNMF